MKSLTTFYELYISPIQEVMRFQPQQKARFITAHGKLTLCCSENSIRSASDSGCKKYENVLMTRSTGTIYISNIIID